MFPRSADFEVGDTAGWETCATSLAEVSFGIGMDWSAIAKLYHLHW
jgi:hypothetical protein